MCKMEMLSETRHQMNYEIISKIIIYGLKEKDDNSSLDEYCQGGKHCGMWHELIEQAMQENKMIIIMREKRRWLKRIKGLADYHNLYTPKSPQSGYLTPNIIFRIDENGIEHYLSETEIKKYFKLS